MINLPIQLQFIETKYGKILLNPLSNHILIPSDDFVDKILKSEYELLLFGETCLSL